MSGFSDETRRSLLAAGWTPERRVPIRGYVALLRREGYLASRPVHRFLRRYGGLALYPGTPGELHFDPARAVQTIQSYEVRACSERVGARLCVIGEAGVAVSVLFIDERGQVYLVTEDVIERVASTGDDAVEALCMGTGDRELIP